MAAIEIILANTLQISKENSYHAVLAELCFIKAMFIAEYGKLVNYKEDVEYKHNNPLDPNLITGLEGIVSYDEFKESKFRDCMIDSGLCLIGLRGIQLIDFFRNLFGYKSLLFGYEPKINRVRIPIKLDYDIGVYAGKLVFSGVRGTIGNDPINIQLQRFDGFLVIQGTIGHNYRRYTLIHEAGGLNYSVDGVQKVLKPRGVLSPDKFLAT